MLPPSQATVRAVCRFDNRETHEEPVELGLTPSPGTILFAFSSHDQPIEYATESKTHSSHGSGFVQHAVTGMLAPPNLARSYGCGLSRRGETPVTAYALTRTYATGPSRLLGNIGLDGAPFRGWWGYVEHHKPRENKRRKGKDY